MLFFILVLTLRGKYRQTGRPVARGIIFSSRLGIDTFPSVEAMMIVLPELDRSNWLGNRFVVFPISGQPP